jgi:replication factor A1
MCASILPGQGGGESDAFRSSIIYCIRFSLSYPDRSRGNQRHKDEFGMTDGMMKIEEITPESKQINLLAKVVNVGEMREIPSRFGPSRKVADAQIGDETGTVILSLWEDQINSVKKDDLIKIENGYVSFVKSAQTPGKGNIRLNIGKYGKMEKVTEGVTSVNEEINLSVAEHDLPDRPRHGGGGRGRSGGGYGAPRRDPPRDRF